MSGAHPFGRWRRVAAALLASTLVGSAMGALPRADDALGGYLERLRLTRLLVTHLENELAAATLPDDRTRLVERLAEVYPELLERETDAARRDALVERSAAFLKRESPKQADPLRLSLLRARYRAASRVAEDHRAALAKPEAVADARSALEAIEREASDLRGRFEGRVRELERRTERIEGLDGERLQERADRARGELAEAHSLEGWSLERLLRECDSRDGPFPQSHAVLRQRARVASAARCLAGERFDSPSASRMAVGGRA
jgi:chromosome segregation ATPase